MKFLVIYGKIKVEKQDIGYVHCRNEKDSTLVCSCGCHSEKSVGYHIDFYQKFMNFMGVTKSYRTTLWTCRAQFHQCKEKCSHKKETLVNVHPQEK